MEVGTWGGGVGGGGGGGGGGGRKDEGRRMKDENRSSHRGAERTMEGVDGMGGVDEHITVDDLMITVKVQMGTVIDYLTRLAN